jgi:hypothetical protein
MQSFTRKVKKIHPAPPTTKLFFHTKRQSITHDVTTSAVPGTPDDKVIETGGDGIPGTEDDEELDTDELPPEAQPENQVDDLPGGDQVLNCNGSQKLKF